MVGDLEDVRQRIQILSFEFMPGQKKQAEPIIEKALDLLRESKRADWRSVREEFDDCVEWVWKPRKNVCCKIWKLTNGKWVAQTISADPTFNYCKIMNSSHVAMIQLEAVYLWNQAMQEVYASDAD